MTMFLELHDRMRKSQSLVRWNGQNFETKRTRKSRRRERKIERLAFIPDLIFVHLFPGCPANEIKQSIVYTPIWHWRGNLGQKIGSPSATLSPVSRPNFIIFVWIAVAAEQCNHDERSGTRGMWSAPLMLLNNVCCPFFFRLVFVCCLHFFQFFAYGVLAVAVVVFVVVAFSGGALRTQKLRSPLQRTRNYQRLLFRSRCRSEYTLSTSFSFFIFIYCCWFY